MRIIDFHGRVTFISLLLSGLCVMLLMLAAGCAAAGDGVLPAPPEETPPSFTFDSASKDELAAARTGLSILAASKQDAVGSPQLIEAQKGPLSEALNRLYNTSAIHYDVWPPETKVWLVVFKGSWQIYPPPDATGEASLPPRYVGCAYALFMAADGQPIQAGDTPCPP